MKPFLILLIASFCLLQFSMFGQGKPNYVGQWYQERSQGKSPVRADVFSPRQSDFARTKRYNLRANVNQLNSLMNTKPELVNLIVPYGDKTYTLNLARVQVTADEFSVRTSQGNSSHDKGVQYRGIVDNNPAHIASLSITKNDKSGFFSTNEGNFVIADEGVDFIIYNDQLMELPETIFCVTPDISYPISIERNLVSGVGCKTVNVYFECDNAFYVNKGSNITTLTDYVIGFFNQVATLYANEDVAIQISEIFAWTIPDPYVSLTTPSAIMNQFKTNRGSTFNGHLAHFLTTRNVGGGIAYVNTLCNKAYSYGVSRIYSTYSNFPTYSWTVNVVAHELGHNLGSPHTHSCSWSGGAIDNCQPPEGTCAAGPAPVNGGTIMSYCQITPVGINFNNGFGILPGNLIRSKVLAASCITSSNTATPPTGLTTTNITSSSATLSWTASAGTNNYTVQYKPASASTWITVGTTSASSINVTGLSAGGSYVWTVKSDCSAFAANASFTATGTGSTTCAAPTSLSASGITQTAATLIWGAVSGATSYTLQYKTSAASTWLTANSSTHSLYISGLTAGTNYVWNVKANCSPYSAQASFVTAASSSSGCLAPDQLNATGITQTAATLSWGAVSGATSYTIQYKTSAASTWLNANATTHSLYISGLTAGTTYVWNVKANCSPYSVQASFVTAASAPSGCLAPGQLSATNIAQTSVTLNWSGVSGATGYTAQIKPSTSSTWTTINTTATSFSVTGLVAGTNYVWQVKASCSSYSPQSSFITASSTTPSGCAGATNLATSSITTNAATLSWTGPTNAQSYNVRYKRVGFSGWTIRNGVTGNSLRITGLSSRSNYDWIISVKCTNGTTSSFSAPKRFTTL